MSKLGENIGQELIRQNLKGEDLARSINGLDPSTLRKLIYRKSSSSKFSAQIAKALGVNLIWLQTGEGNREIKDNKFNIITNNEPQDLDEQANSNQIIDIIEIVHCVIHIDVFLKMNSKEQKRFIKLIITALNTEDIDSEKTMRLLKSAL